MVGSTANKKKKKKREEKKIRDDQSCHAPFHSLDVSDCIP